MSEAYQWNCRTHQHKCVVRKFRQKLCIDRKRTLECGLGPGVVLEVDVNVTETLVVHREIALPARVVGVDLRQTFSDGEAVAEGFQRVGQVALRDQNVADLFVGDREIALPAGVARIGLGQTTDDVLLGSI